MKIAFIHTDIHKINPQDRGNSGMVGWHHMQFGISYLSAYLKNKGHDTTLVFINKHPWERHVYEKIAAYRPDIVCFGSVSTQFTHVLNIAKFLRRNFPDIYQVFGGIHATVSRLDLPEVPFDAACRGEGELPLSELVEKLVDDQSPRDIMNLIVKEGGKTFINPLRPFIEDLDGIPFPDRKMWEEYVDDPSRNIILASRGCPFECTYCSNKFLRTIADGKYVRFRSPQNIIEELQLLLADHPATKEIFLESETIAENIVWLEELCLKLREVNLTSRRDLMFGANIRISKKVDYATVFGLLKTANFRSVKIGIESGSDRIRKEVLHRDYSNEDIYKIFGTAKRYGIKTDAYNIIGLPDETPIDFKETIEVNRICKPADPHLSIFFPYPGTELYDISLKKGYLRRDLCDIEEREEAALEIPAFPIKTIEKHYAKFLLDIYKGERPLARLYMDYIYKRYISKSRVLLKFYLFARRIGRLIYKNPVS